jgi:hypothetical protein
MLKSDKQRRSYDHCKFGSAAENPFLYRSSYLDKFRLEITSNGKLIEPGIQRL